MIPHAIVHFVARRDAHIEDREDAIVLGIVESHAPVLLAVEEVEREVGDPVVTADALARLDAAGLVHRLDGFVWLTRPAMRARELYG